MPAKDKPRTALEHVRRAREQCNTLRDAIRAVAPPEVQEAELSSLTI